jgi:alcohol dehydrogenase class IV
MLLPAVTAFSIKAATQRYAECARAMGIASAVETNDEAVDTLITALYCRNEELQVPSPKKYDLAGVCGVVVILDRSSFSLEIHSHRSLDMRS